MDVREKLVELLCSNSLHRDGVTMYDVADHLIANGVTVQEWISTDERLPTEDDATDGYVAVVYSWGDGVKTKTISLVDVVIAHPDLYDYWMPLNLPQRGLQIRRKTEQRHLLFGRRLLAIQRSHKMGHTNRIKMD